MPQQGRRAPWWRPPFLRRADHPAQRDSDLKVVLGDYYGALAAAGITSASRARPWPVERAVAEGYERLVYVFRSVEAIAGQASRLPFRLKETSTGDILDDHPLYRVLNKKANPIETGRQFRKRLGAQILLSKRGAFVQLTQARNGDILRMDLLPPGRTRPVPSGSGNTEVLIDHYEVVRADGTRSDIPAEQVRWFREPHPLDPYSGVTPLEAAGMSAELDFFARLYNVQFMKNDGRPGGIVGISGDMEPDDMDRIERKFGHGPAEAGKLTVIAGEVSYVDSVVRPRDMQYGTLAGTAKQELLTAFGVPESVLGYAADRKYDNASQEHLNFWQITMPPYLDLQVTGLDDLSDDSIEGFFDVSQVPVLQAAEAQAREEKRTEFAAGLITPDEYRVATGQEPFDVPATRALYISSSVTPVPTSKADASALAGTIVSGGDGGSGDPAVTGDDGQGDGGGDGGDQGGDDGSPGGDDGQGADGEAKALFAEERHPRGRDGKWIEVGKDVTLPGGLRGEVTGMRGNSVIVNAADGTHRVVPAGQLASAPRSAAHGGFRSMHAMHAPAAAPVAAAPDPKSFLRAHYADWRAGLTPGQDRAMRFYQSPGFGLMNGLLRGRDREDLKSSEHATDSDLDRAAKASRDLAAAIRKSPPLPHGMRVYRALSASQFTGAKPGDILSDPGFTSTSVSDDVSMVGRGGVQARAVIDLPEGTRAAAGSERELVLPPGGRFRVVSSRPLHLEYLPARAGSVKSASRPRLRVISNCQVKTISATPPGDGEVIAESPADEQARQRLEDQLSVILAGLAVRWQQRTIARLASPKARKGTRHWQPDPQLKAADTRGGDQPLDAAAITDGPRWQTDAEDAVRAVIEAAAVAEALRLASSLAPRLPVAQVTMAARGAARQVIAMIGRGAAGLATRVAALISDRDQAGDDAAAISGTVRDALGDQAAWAAQVATQAATAAQASASDAAARVINATSDDPAVQVTGMWRSRRDALVRDTHQVADGQVRPAGSPFLVGGALLAYPGDPAGPPGEVRNCRCALNHRMVRTGRYVPAPPGTPAALRRAAG